MQPLQQERPHLKPVLHQSNLGYQPPHLKQLRATSFSLGDGTILWRLIVYLVGQNRAALKQGALTLVLQVFVKLSGHSLRHSVYQ